jgi:P27 family predicted phage terminase small subunit
MAKGQGKKSTSASKKLRGTYNVTREVDNEMEVSKLEDVETPTQLINQFAVNEWDRVSKELIAVDMLFVTDTSMLLAYCNEIGKYFDCIEKCKDGLTFITPNGHEMPKPEATEGNKALSNAIKLSDKFGFNPLARTKIQMEKKKEDNDPFKDF